MTTKVKFPLGDLPAIATFAETRGFSRLAPIGEYEVLRMVSPTDNSMLFFYKTNRGLGSASGASGLLVMAFYREKQNG